MSQLFLSSTYFDQSYARSILVPTLNSPCCAQIPSSQSTCSNLPISAHRYSLIPPSTSSCWTSAPPCASNAGIRTDLYLPLPFREYRFSVFLLRCCITPTITNARTNISASETTSAIGPACEFSRGQLIGSGALVDCVGVGLVYGISWYGVWAVRFIGFILRAWRRGR